jgi:hypothetical protein
MNIFFKLTFKAQSSPSFALISVLALVSLAALTATAFLASARLERQATMPLTQTTKLDMALNAGAATAAKLLDYAPDQQFNHVTTYWRGTNANDWTNELGYLLDGAVPKATTDGTYEVKYRSCFSSQQFTNLGSEINLTLEKKVTFPGRFNISMGSYMETQTNFANGQSTNIPLLGNQTSPPVGWVYIRQDVRVKPGQTNTTNVPVARFAFYVQDQSSMIDAERMGGETNRSTGTNPVEISLTNLTGTALIAPAKVDTFTASSNRPKYLTPGMLTLSLAGGLNTNDLRYVTTGLRHWTNASERIPKGLGYSNGGTTDIGTNKYCLTPVSSLTIANIRNHITSNCPPFATNGTNGRAGGMDGTAYVTALAANIIDYVDTDSTPTTTSINGVNVVGFDNYPMLTHVFDQFVYSSTAKNITITTYLQFWNPSSVPTPALTGGTFTYNLNDIIRYPTNTTTPLSYTNRPLTNAALANSNFNFGGAPFSFPANSGFITSITNTIDLANAANFPNFPTTAPPSVQLNNDGTGGFNDDATNSFTLTGLGATNRPPIVLNRGTTVHTLINNVPSWIGSVLGSRMSSGEGSAGSSRLYADPRMLNYIGVGTTKKMANASYENVYWQGYPAVLTNALLSGHPGNWPDGTNTANNPIPTRGITNPTVPPPGPFVIKDSLTLIADPAPCKISNFGSYTNICELGNIFDPIQWAPPTTTTNYANCNINTNAGSIWTSNNLYGGGSTLRIGRPEHSRFAWTNMGGGAPMPNMQMSAAALLDLFCVSTNYSEAGKINLNTAPAPVLRALAGGILLANAGNHAVPSGMAEAFAQGVMRFRAQYPFYSPSQLAFINTSTDWSQGATGVARIWPSNAVFGNTNPILLSDGTSAQMNLAGWNDQAAEEWFSKIFSLSTVYSRNFRVYVIAQKATTNSSGAFIGVGPVVRKYYNLLIEQNGIIAPDKPTPDPGATPVITFQSYY